MEGRQLTRIDLAALQQTTEDWRNRIGNRSQYEQ
jgi:hypothetical protein